MGMMMSDVTEEFFEGVAAVIRKQDENAIWDLDDIAEYLKLQPDTVRKKAKQNGFPRPCRFQKNRWPASRIREWANRV